MSVTMTINLRTDAHSAPSFKTEAEIFGQLAVHNAYTKDGLRLDDEYSLTHILSGFAVEHRRVSREDMVDLAQRLIQFNFDGYWHGGVQAFYPQWTKSQQERFIKEVKHVIAEWRMQVDGVV